MASSDRLSPVPQVETSRDITMDCPCSAREVRARVLLLGRCQYAFVLDLA